MCKLPQPCTCEVNSSQMTKAEEATFYFHNEEEDEDKKATLCSNSEGNNPGTKFTRFYSVS